MKKSQVTSDSSSNQYNKKAIDTDDWFVLCYPGLRRPASGLQNAQQQQQHERLSQWGIAVPLGRFKANTYNSYEA